MKNCFVHCISLKAECGVHAAGRIDEVIQTKSSIEAAENPGKVEVKNGVVRFEHVNFRYPGAEEDVLHLTSALCGRTWKDNRDHRKYRL